MTSDTVRPPPRRLAYIRHIPRTTSGRMFAAIPVRMTEPSAAKRGDGYAPKHIFAATRITPLFRYCPAAAMLCPALRDAVMPAAIFAAPDGSADATIRRCRRRTMSTF